MKGLADFLEYLYELDFSHVNPSLIAKALIQFLIGVVLIYASQFIFERFQVYFLYVSIPLIISIAYSFYSGLISLRNAFRKKGEEYLVYVEGDH